MKCPHCTIAIHASPTRTQVADYPGVQRQDATVSRVLWFALHQRCPECLNEIIDLERTLNPGAPTAGTETFMAYPRTSLRPVPRDVPEPYRTDFVEAAMVLRDSPKASAALSRRCLQCVLRDAAKARPSDLSKEIDEVIPKLPSYLAEAIDAIRNVGNFAAHPIKSTNTGEIVPVENGEAEWLLDVLEGLFDFYFVQPAALKKKRLQLDKKLVDAGKPPMK